MAQGSSETAADWLPSEKALLKAEAGRLAVPAFEEGGRVEGGSGEVTRSARRGVTSGEMMLTVSGVGWDGVDRFWSLDRRFSRL